LTDKLCQTEYDAMVEAMLMHERIMQERPIRLLPATEPLEQNRDMGPSAVMSHDDLLKLPDWERREIEAHQAFIDALDSYQRCMSARR
jgi:hypothetical protein